jgi:hypothetical protein
LAALVFDAVRRRRDCPDLRLVVDDATPRDRRPPHERQRRDRRVA